MADGGTEADDIRAARDGDRDAFARLYKHHAPAVHGYLYRSGAGGRTEDLVAETFVRAYRAIGRYEDRGVSFRAWLFRIATNLSIQHARKKSSGELATAELLAVSDAAGPERLAVQADRARALTEALGALEPRDRSVVVLRYLEDLPAAEVADVLGLTEANVRQIARRSLGKLQGLLSAHAEEAIERS